MANLSVEQAVELAFQHHQAGRFTSAQTIYTQILDRFPNNANVLHLQGLIALQFGQYNDAINLIAKAINIESTVPEFFNNFGEALRGAGQFAEAISNYERALKLKPNYAEARNNLGNAWMSLGKVDLAEECYRHAISAQHGYADAHYNLGRALAAQEKFAAAIPSLQEAIRQRPDFSSAYYHLGNALRETGNPDGAVASFRAAIKWNPDFPDAYNNLGNLLLEPAQTSERTECYKKAIALQPTHIQANTTFGTLLQQSEQYEAAAQCFKRVLEVDPDNEPIQHLLNAVQQHHADRAPLAYIRQVYDGYAQEFDSHLTQGLGYRIPQELSTLLRHNTAIPAGGLDIADLGCGTGLCGVALKDIARSLIGVDASAKMLEKASQRGIYDKLICADLMILLHDSQAATLDLIVATDVLIYTGDLSEIFKCSARVLRQGGALAFSVESSGKHGADFELQLCGRYSHAPAYPQRLAGEYGFIVSVLQPVVIRAEREIPVPGYIFILSKCRPNS